MPSPAFTWHMTCRDICSATEYIADGFSDAAVKHQEHARGLTEYSAEVLMNNIHAQHSWAIQYTEKNVLLIKLYCIRSRSFAVRPQAVLIAELCYYGTQNKT